MTARHWSAGLTTHRAWPKKSSVYVIMGTSLHWGTDMEQVQPAQPAHQVDGDSVRDGIRQAKLHKPGL